MEITSKFHFWHYLHFAYEEYCKYVKELNYTYHRYCVNFLNGHKFPLCGEDVNEHERIMGSLAELLIQRQLLVEFFFKRDTLSEKELRELQNAHNTTDPGRHPIEKGVNHPAVIKSETLAKSITENTICGINRSIDESDLDDIAVWFSTDDPALKVSHNWFSGGECFYEGVLTGADMKRFFEGRMSLHIREYHNQLVLMKIDALATKGLVVKNWRPIVVHNESLISGKTNRPLSDNQIYSSLSVGKTNHRERWASFVEFAGGFIELHE